LSCGGRHLPWRRERRGTTLHSSHSVFCLAPVKRGHFRMHLEAFRNGFRPENGGEHTASYLWARGLAARWLRHWLWRSLQPSGGGQASGFSEVLECSGRSCGGNGSAMITPNILQ